MTDDEKLAASMNEQIEAFEYDAVRMHLVRIERLIETGAPIDELDKKIIRALLAVAVDRYKDSLVEGQ